jgi:hypothetical protein
MGGQACTHRSPLFEKQGRAHASCYQRGTPPRPASSTAAAWGCERAPHNAIVCWSLHVACCIGLMHSHPTTLRTKFAQTPLHSTNNVPRGMRCRRHAEWLLTKCSPACAAHPPRSSCDAAAATSAPMSYGVRFMVGAVCRGAVCSAHRVLCCGTSYVQCACIVSRIDALRGTLRVRSPRDWHAVRDPCGAQETITVSTINTIISTLTALVNRHFLHPSVRAMRMR